VDVLTIPEAARATGSSPREIRRRIERGLIRASWRGGVRVVERRELDSSLAALDAVGGTPAAGPIVVRELLERVERQAVELAQLRKMLEEAEARHQQDRRRLEAGLREARAARRHESDDQGAGGESGGAGGGMRESLAPLFGRGGPSA
jgi:hypothetical protein